MAKVTVKLNKDGTATIEGSGFSGPACTVLINKLAEKLGLVTNETLLNEYYEEGNEIHIGTDVCKD